MSKVIDSFLVEIGFDVDKESSKDSQQSIDNIKGSALQMGAALAAALAATGYVAIKANKDIADLNNQAVLLGNVGTGELHKFQKMFELAGESAEGANATFAKFEDLLVGAKVGDGPWEDLVHAGIPDSFLKDAKTSIELFEKLSEVMHTLNPDQQHYAVKAFSLNDGAQVLLKGGPEKLQQYIDSAKRTSDITQGMADQSKEMTEAFTEMGHAWNGLINTFAAEAAPGLEAAAKNLTDVLVRLDDAAGFFGKYFGDSIDPNAKKGLPGINPRISAFLPPALSSLQYAAKGSEWIANKVYDHDKVGNFLLDINKYTSGVSPSTGGLPSARTTFGDTNITINGGGDGHKMGAIIESTYVEAMKARMDKLVSGVEG